MERFLFMGKALEIIATGVFFKKAYGMILRVLAVVTGIAGLVGWISAWRNMFLLSGYTNPVGVILGGVFVQLLMVVFFYAVIHCLWLRAKTIEALPETGYAIIPIISVTLKLSGELLACVQLFLGIAGGLFLWFAGLDISQILGGSYFPLGMGTTGFLGGLLSILFGIAAAFGSLIFFYFLSELTIVLVDIAESLKASAKGASK